MNEIVIYFAAYDLARGEAYVHETEYGTFGDETGRIPRQADWVDEQTLLLYTAETGFSREHQELWRLGSGPPEAILRAQAEALNPATPDRFWITYRTTPDGVERYIHRSERTESVTEAPAGVRYPRLTESANHLLTQYADNWFEIISKDDLGAGTQVYLWDAEHWASWNDQELLYVTPGAEEYLLRVE